MSPMYVHGKFKFIKFSLFFRSPASCAKKADVRRVWRKYEEAILMRLTPLLN